MLIVLLVIIAVVAIYIFATYNKFVTVKTRITASIQEIGNQLKRQADLIPNLVNSVKGYMVHEQAALDKITKARMGLLDAVESGDVSKMIDASDVVKQALGSIRVMVESTPELKAAGPTTKMMNELRDTSDKVMYSRRTLIDLSADYNVMVVTMPSALVAKMFKFDKVAGLKTPETGRHVEVSEEDTKTPRVEL